MLQDKLETLRKRIAGCHLTAFGDLSTGLILRTSASKKVPRERLDKLSSLAETSFEMRDALLELEVPQATDIKKCAIFFSPCEASVFVRQGDGENDVTLTIIEAGHCLENALQETASCAEKIAEEAE